MALRLPRIQTLEMVVRCDGKKSSLKEKLGREIGKREGPVNSTNQEYVQ